MAKWLRGLLLGSVALAFLYLLVHAREPLRLNVGDPWSDANVLSSMSYVKSYGFLATSFTDVLDVGPLTADSYHYIHYPPFAEIFYGAVGKYLGVSDIGTLRLFALAWAGLAMWLLYSYARRLYSDRIALIATALFTTSPLWMMYADSIHQTPVMWASAFLALWGLVRAIETRQRRHFAAALLGSFVCFFTSYDCYIFLPAAVLVTVYLKLGNPFARGTRHFVAVCAAGCTLGIAAKCLAVIGAVGWNEFVDDLRLQFLERATSTHDRAYEAAVFPTLVRRLTLVFTPFVWIPVAFHAIKAIRAPTLGSALKDTAAWMLLAALAFVAVFSELAASQMLASQVFLPFYAIGSALLIDRMLDGRKTFRRVALGWIIAAPVWTFAILLSHPRSVLDRADVARTNDYLAEHDHNDFVMTNLLSGHIQPEFHRHAWFLPDAADPGGATRQMMLLFERTGADAVHEVIFTDPDSRFIDKSLWPVTLPKRLWAVTGWPHLFRSKTNAVIAAYDRHVLENLEALKAEKVLEASNYVVYRVDRNTVAALLAEPVPSVTHIDFGNVAVARHLLLGWGATDVLAPEQIAVTGVVGFERCSEPRSATHGNACKSILTKYGLAIKGAAKVRAAQLMLRLDQACDVRLTFQFGTTSYVRVSMNGFAAAPPPSRTATVTVPASHVNVGNNILELENLFPPGVELYAASLDISELCTKP